MAENLDPDGTGPAVPFPLGATTDRATAEGWTAWRFARDSFAPALLSSR